MNTKPTTKEICIDFDTSEAEVRGKLAWNDNWQVGGTIHSVDERGANIGNCYYSTCTGGCVFDSLFINGFKVYENEQVN